MNVKIVVAVLLFAVALVALDHFDVPLPGRDSAAERLVTHNLVVRGGADAWADVKTLRLTGSMELGQGLEAPYILEQSRPDKMRLEFVFDGATTIQIVNGDQGWKLAPFVGRSDAEPMTTLELRETAASGSPGLLLDYKELGHQVVLLGDAEVEGNEAKKLEVTLANGAVRWLYIDAKTGLELKLEAIRTIAGRDQLVETYYREWRNSGELMFPSRQQSRVVGKEQWNWLTVDQIEVNPQLNDSRFGKPMPAVELGAKS